MKRKFYRNCSLMRVLVKQGQKEVYFPTNVDWVGKKIDKLVIGTPNTSSAVYDPVSGNVPVATATSNIKGFVTLYDTDNREIMHNTHWIFIASSNNCVLEVNAVLNLSLCKIVLTAEQPADIVLLFYAFYNTEAVEDADLPSRMVATHFTLEPMQRLTLRELIHDYVHALPGAIKGIYAYYANTAFVTLRDKKLSYMIDNVPLDMMRYDCTAPAFAGGAFAYAWSIQKEPFLLDNVDVDFDYSFIQNGVNAKNEIQITFLY